MPPRKSKPEAVTTDGKPVRERIWNRLGYDEQDDLIFHYPRRYEDRSQWQDPFRLSDGDWVTFKGEIATVKVERWRRGRTCTKIMASPTNSFGLVQVQFFNMPFIKATLKEGKEVIFHGRIGFDKNGPKLTHPEYEVVNREEDPRIHLDRLTPIYPLKEGVSQRVLRRTIFKLLNSKEQLIDEASPAPKELGDQELALRNIHFPESFPLLQHARKRLAFDELLLTQLLMAERRARMQQVNKPREEEEASYVEPFMEALPFEMTGAQKGACREIDGDLKKSWPMNRLLQGDVGSGKTLVAAHALLRTLEQGNNGALMAPTETLAEQHATNLRKLLDGLGIEIVLWTRTSRPEEGLISYNIPTIFVGTHALFQDKVKLPRLGLAVVDEQHKFGVLQRMALQSKGSHPDLLVMTATPIPRTLCLTLYGDLEISTLDELPPGRTPVRTVLRSRDELPKVWDFIHKEIDAGRQAYIVYPLVEESEKLDAKSVKAGVKELQEVFGKDRVVILHGKMDASEKAKAMADFRSGKRPVMVATSVIEVGVDVPTATMMVVESAERFGLAQLHQLRGRVGRGTAKSYCVLVAKPSKEENDESWQRLKIMEETTDGFRLAEEDFKIRGPGNVLGTEQSGLPPLKVASLTRDFDLIPLARDFAEQLLSEDPNLDHWPFLQEQLQKYKVASAN